MCKTSLDLFAHRTAHVRSSVAALGAGPARAGRRTSLADGGVDYDDGTPATATQMAKDVTTFLVWTSEPEQDERKLAGFKVMVALTVMFGFTWYYKRVKWSPIKNRRLELY